jgi:hypothetical protein
MYHIKQSYIVLGLLCAALALPELVLAADAPGKYGIDDTTSKDIVDSARSYWGVISNVAVLAGLGGAVFMFFVDKRWVIVPGGIAFIGAFGEKIAAFLLKAGDSAGGKLMNKSEVLDTLQMLAYSGQQHLADGAWVTGLFS